MSIDSMSISSYFNKTVLRGLYIYIYIYIPNMYLESYMSRVLDIPKYRANKDKDKDKINLVYFIRFIHYKLTALTALTDSIDSIACHTKQVCSE